jgi:hypothetical protein
MMQATAPGSTIDLALDQIVEITEEGINILGIEWFSRQSTKDMYKREAVQQADRTKQRLRYTPQHPIIQWHYEFSKWREAIASGLEVQANQSTLELASFTRDLIKVKNASGLEHVLARLQKPKEFSAAAFEVEVAASYVNREWEVEFIQPSNERSPDIKVTTNNGLVFWVECKCRQLSGRDSLISVFWENLQEKLYRSWMPSKMNFGVLLTTAYDPVHSDLEEVADAIMRAANQLYDHPEKRRLGIQGKVVADKYVFRLQYLSDPDEELPFSGYNDGGADWYSMEGEVMYNSKGEGIIRNPKFYGFTNTNPPDKYLGVLNAFKSAVGQLPDQGPGVIWLRVPVPADGARSESDMRTMVKMLESEVSGRHNTRVNCIILSARFFANEQNQGQPAIAYRHISSIIEHNNPKFLLASPESLSEQSFV